jgi:hypothetical protein
MRRRLPKRRESQSEEIHAPLGALGTVCWACGAPFEENESFCTTCGEPLQERSRADRPSRSSSRVEKGERLEERPRQTKSRWRWVWFVVSAIFITAAAALVLVTIAWQNEVTRQHDTQGQLDKARLRVATLSNDLATTRVKLARNRALSNRRRLVILKAQRVLGRLDPVLSTVDDLQGIAGESRSLRDEFAADSAQLEADSVELWNYSVDHPNPTDAEYAYENGLVDRLNSEADAVEEERTRLDEYDGTYADTSDRFDRQASAFTGAVRSLQHLLKAVTK